MVIRPSYKTKSRLKWLDMNKPKISRKYNKLKWTDKNTNKIHVYFNKP